MSSYLQLKKRAFMSIVNGVKGFVRSVQGVPPISLEDCVDSDSLIDWKLYGNSVQDGTPTPEAPIPVASVGEYDSETGKYKVPVVARGKNLFDKSKSELGTIQNETAGEYWGDVALNNQKTIQMLQPNTTYTISFDIETIEVPTGDNITIKSKTAGFALFSGIGGRKTYALFNDIQLEQGESYHIEKTVTIKSEFNDNEANYRLTTYANRYIDENNKSYYPKVIFRNIQIEQSDTATDYEPYHAPITTNLFLDEPLRKVGDYADYVDFGKGEVIRNTAEITFDGSEAWYKTDKFMYLSVRNMQSSAKGFSTHIVFSTLTGATADIYFYATAKVLRMYQSSENPHFSDIEAFKAFLTEQAEAGTPVKVTYILAEPTRTPISIPKLPTIKGTTIYEIGTSLNASNMEATYYSSIKGE